MTQQTTTFTDNLQCLVYTSRGTKAFSDQELQGILQKSRFNNSRDGVSGMLLYVKGTFFQLLEGPKDKVEATYQRIARDPRHAAVTTVKSQAISQRHFPAWTMGFPTPSAHILSKLGGYSDLKQPGSQDLARLKSHQSGIYDLLCSFARQN